MNHRRPALAVACLAVTLPLSGQIVKAEPVPTDTAPEPYMPEDQAPSDNGATEKGAWRNGQIHWTSPDGNLDLRPHFLAQGDLAWWHGTRFSPDHVFEFGLSGSAFKDFRFDFTGYEAQNSDLTFRDAWVDYTAMRHVLYGQNIGVRAGLFDDNAWKEQGGIYDPYTLFLKRSLTNDLVGNGPGGPQVGGVRLFLGDDCDDGNDGSCFHSSLTLRQHADRQIYDTDFLENVNGFGPKRLGVSARADFLTCGNWYQTHDLSGKIGRVPTTDFGAGFAFDNFGNGNVIRPSVDVQYNDPNRWNVFAAATLNYTDFTSNNFGGGGSRTDWGFLVQGSYYLTPAVQLAARYDFTKVDSGFKLNGTSHFQEISLGVNYYMGRNGSLGNHVKLSADVNFLPDGAPADTNLNYTNVTPGNSRVFFRFGAQVFF